MGVVIPLRQHSWHLRCEIKWIIRKLGLTLRLFTVAWMLLNLWGSVSRRLVQWPRGWRFPPSLSLCPWAQSTVGSTFKAAAPIGEWVNEMPLWSYVATSRGELCSSWDGSPWQRQEMLRLATQQATRGSCWAATRVCVFIWLVIAHNEQVEPSRGSFCHQCVHNSHFGAEGGEKPRANTAHLAAEIWRMMLDSRGRCQQSASLAPWKLIKQRKQERMIVAVTRVYEIWIGALVCNCQDSHLCNQCWHVMYYQVIHYCN